MLNLVFPRSAMYPYADEFLEQKILSISCSNSSGLTVALEALCYSESSSLCLETHCSYEGLPLNLWLRFWKPLSMSIS